MSKTQKRSNPQPKPAASSPRWIMLDVGLILVIGTAAIVLLSNQGSDYTPEVTGQPSLQVDEDVIDFGDVTYSKPVEAVFNIRNVGDKSLQVLGEPRVELVRGC